MSAGLSLGAPFGTDDALVGLLATRMRAKRPAVRIGVGRALFEIGRHVARSYAEHDQRAQLASIWRAVSAGASAVEVKP